jgi:hypothetical protein
MKAYVIVEGQVDAELLAPLLEGLDIKLLPANGRSSVLSLARTLLLTKELPVLVVVDVDDEDGAEIRDVLESGMAQVAPSRRWKCLLFEPDIETELLALIPAAIRRKAKNKTQRRGLMQSAVQSGPVASKMKALSKMKSAISFIKQWNTMSAGLEAAV